MQTHKVAEDDDKFNLVVGFLDLRAIDDFANLTASSPAGDKYAVLKAAIIKRTDASCLMSTKSRR